MAVNHRHKGKTNTDQIPTLPAHRTLGNLADVRPTIVTDTREQTPLPFARLTTERATLTTGDYSFRGAEELFAVERKTIADLVACCIGANRERFFWELHRLRGYRLLQSLIKRAAFVPSVTQSSTRRCPCATDPNSAPLWVGKNSAAG